MPGREGVKAGGEYTNERGTRTLALGPRQSGFLIPAPPFQAG